MNFEILEELVKKWTEHITNLGFDPPDTDEEWIELIRECVEKEWEIEE